MAANINRVVISGYLTRDCEVRETNGNKLCKGTLASNWSYKDRETGAYTDRPAFLDFTLWGPRGEAFVKFHAKGSRVLLEGALRYDAWEDKKTHEKRSKLYLNVDNWDFVGSRPSKERIDVGPTKDVRPEDLPDDESLAPF